MKEQMYKMTYEMPTANGSTVIHTYKGIKENMIQAIQIARVHKYKILTVERI